LARDYALAERVLPNRVPDFFDIALTDNEQNRVREYVEKEQETHRGNKVKLQFFAARFKLLPPHSRHLRLYIYLIRSGQKQQIIERIITD
jgi:hypothetical protein